jgi:hypothetical protein
MEKLAQIDSGADVIGRMNSATPIPSKQLRGGQASVAYATAVQTLVLAKRVIHVG